MSHTALVDEILAPLTTSIEPSASVVEAKARMEEAQLQYLPVMEGESLVGLLTSRDLSLAANLSENAEVRDLLTMRPITVPLGTSVHDAVARMLDERVGAVVVIDAGHVKGIITHYDVFRVFGERAFGEEGVEQPTEIRQRVLDEHRKITVILDKIEGLAEQLKAGDADSEVLLRRAIFELHEVMRHHMAYEERTLLPVLRSSDSFGPAEVAAFIREHQVQRNMLEKVATELAGAEKLVELIGSVLDLVRAIRDDIEHEGREFLNEDLFRSTPARGAGSAG